MKSKVVSGAVILLVALACSPKGKGAAEAASPDAAGAGGPDTAGKPSPNEYVVYVDKLNLRNSAGTGDVVAVLTRGDVVTRTGGEEWVPGAAGSPPEPWFGVEAGAGNGWLAGRYVVPRELFGDYGRADELGEAGKAREMVEELAGVTAAREVPGSPPESNVLVSPDGRKAACWGGFLGDDPNTVVFGPLMYFEAGEGLADVFYGFASEGWSGDSRYIGLAAQGKFLTYDTSSGRLTLADDGYGYRCEFVAGYFVYKAFGSRSGEGGDLPAVRAYNPATGEKVDLLTADPSSVRPFDVATAEARLEPVASCPEALTASALYKELNGAFVPCRESGP